MPDHLTTIYEALQQLHREGGHSDDIEMLEIVMPADYATVEVPSV